MGFERQMPMSHVKCFGLLVKLVYADTDNWNCV